jgi:hypothetical protein
VAVKKFYGRIKHQRFPLGLKERKAMNLINLDDLTRGSSVKEIEQDLGRGALYISSRLSAKGAAEYSGLLLSAVRNGTVASLANELRAEGRLNTTEERRKPSGGFTTARIPVNAADMLAEGEFNRFYIRGLCVRAIAEGIPSLVVYRAKHVENPRSASEALIGSLISVDKLLKDLRENIGTDTALGLPAGPNSGLSVCFPQSVSSSGVGVDAA